MYLSKRIKVGTIVQIKELLYKHTYCKFKGEKKNMAKKTIKHHSMMEYKEIRASATQKHSKLNRR